MSNRQGGQLPHEFEQVRIGGHVYTFRTLSISQVAAAQQTLKTLLHLLLPLRAKAAKDITALEDATIGNALKNLFAIICPGLSQINERCESPGCRAKWYQFWKWRAKSQEPHPDYYHLQDSPVPLARLTAFYMRQDWSKLMQMMEAGESRAVEQTPQEARETFTIICKVVATFWNINTLDFFDLRFEEAADLIIQCNKAWDESNGGKMRLEEFLTHAGHMLGDAGDCEPVTVAPGFMAQFTREN